MKSLMKFGMAAVVAFGFATSAMAADSKADQAAVDKAVHEIVAAYGEGPAGFEKYFSYYADDMTILTPGMRWTKQDYYKFWKATNDKGNGVAAAKIEDLVIQMLSPTSAVTTYLMPVTVRYPDGKVPEGAPAGINWLMSEVWVKEANGKWICKSLMFHQKPVPKT